LCDRPEEGGDFRDELGGAAEFGDSIDDGTADDNAVGKGGDLASLFGCGDTKTHADGKEGRFFQEGNFFTEGGREILLHARDALPGYVVDEARSGGDERANTGFGCGGGDENDAAQIASSGEVVGGFFGWKIEEKEAIGSGLNGGRFKLFPAESENRIVVGEKDEGNVALFFPELGDELKNTGKSGA